MLIYNKDIMYIDKANLSIDNVFRALYNCVGKAVYVKGEYGIIEGIISPSDFCKYYIDNSGNEFNSSFSFIRYDDSEEKMRKEAKELFITRGIRGAIPVINKDGIIEGEYIELEEIKCEQYIEEHKNRFEEYRTSLYMHEEVDALEKLLCGQKITIVGSETEFEKKLGFLFPDRSNVNYANDDIYQLLVAGEGLFIDVTDEYPLRWELYNIIGIGYKWDVFICYLEKKVNERNVSRYEFLIENNKSKEFIQYLIRTCSRIEYDYEQMLETSFVIYCLRCANVNITVSPQRIKKNNNSRVYFKRCDESIENFPYGINVCLYFYLFEKDLYTINNSYNNIILNYYMGNNIKLFQPEKKWFELYECIEKSGEWYLLIDQIRKTFEGDTMEFTDYCHDRFTYENGLRKTLYQPGRYKGTIYCVGACTMYGAFVEDEYTVPTILQKELNDRELLYRVINLGWLYDYSLLPRIQRTRIESNDIIIIFHHDYMIDYKKEYCIDISERIEAMHDRIFFGNMYDHVNSAGSEAIAKSMLPELLQVIEASKGKGSIKRNNVYDLYKMMPLEYKQRRIIEKTITEMESASKNWSEVGRIGAIVMNANPFTNGHLYLVQQALNCVDYLFVFVVEEDNSYFSFTDRINMVSMGVAQYSDRVAVIPSGVIISKTTFVDYFNSQKNYREEYISTIFDQIVFARYIAPVGKITVRFVGTEDGDNTTAQYNRDMKKVLPYYGIEVREIQRIKCDEDKEIRAGDVRTAYRVGDFTKIRNIVPDTTYRYLIETRKG